MKLIFTQRFLHISGYIQI